MPRPKTPKIPVFKKQLDAVAALATIPADKLMDALLNSGDRRFVSLANCMGDPQMRKLSIAQLCTMNSIGVKDVAAVFKDQMIAEGTIKQMHHAPDILETNAVAAKGKEVLCPTCKGKKTLVEECQRCEGAGKDDEGHPCRACNEAGSVEIGPCRTCGATGWVTEAGDPNAFKGFMESAGLSKQSGPMVSIQQNFGNSGSFEQLMMEAERKAKVIEGKAE